MRISGLIAGCVVAITLCSGYACKPGAGNHGTTESGQVTNPADSLEKKELVRKLEAFNQHVDTAGQRNKIPYPLLNENDSIVYYTLDGELIRVYSNMVNSKGSIWPTYFLQHDTLVHVRLRKLVIDSTNHYAQEIMIYLQDGKPFYIEERRMDLQPGEIPALLRLQPYTVSQRTFTETEKEYMEYWPKLKQAVEAHRTSSSPSN